MNAFEALETLAQRSLTRREAADVFSRLVAGRCSEIELAGLLGAIKARGETPEEIAGAAEALRAAARPFPRPDGILADTCGTGGDGSGTLNVSTAAAIVAAEMGIPVAKHGNRAVSSLCGSADVLEQLGIRLETPPEISRRCLDQAGLCFLFAPLYHEGIRHAMRVRRALATRTIFNLVGPLANPARPTYQIVGAWDAALCRPLALTLGMLGVVSALVVHGSGIDEIAVHGPTRAALWRDGSSTDIEITPEQAGMQRRPLEALRGGSPAANAAALLRLLEGKGDEAFADAVALNAGALAWLVGLEADLAGGAARAREVIAGGGAIRRLECWKTLSRGAREDGPGGSVLPDFDPNESDRGGEGCSTRS